MKSFLYPHSVIGHVDLIVKDLEKVLAFYIDVLGFKVLERTKGKAVLTADGKTGLLFLEQKEDVKLRESRTTGLYHIAFLLPHRSHLANIVDHFIQLRYPLQGAADHHVSEAVYLADPEGNGIEIYIDRAPETWKWDGDQVYMTTEALNTASLIREASETGWSGMPGETVIGHIHLQVNDLHKAKEFYCEGLGFDLMLKYGSQALFIAKDKYHHHIGLNTWNSLGALAPDEHSAGLKHFTIVLPSEEALHDVIRNLEKMNAWVSTEGGKVMTKDPSGIYIQLDKK